MWPMCISFTLISSSSQSGGKYFKNNVLNSFGFFMEKSKTNFFKYSYIILWVARTTIIFTKADNLPKRFFPVNKRVLFIFMYSNPIITIRNKHFLNHIFYIRKHKVREMNFTLIRPIAKSYKIVIQLLMCD